MKRKRVRRLQIRKGRNGTQEVCLNRLTIKKIMMNICDIEQSSFRENDSIHLTILIGPTSNPNSRIGFYKEQKKRKTTLIYQT